MFLTTKLRDKSRWATRFSFPLCVNDLLCPDSVVLSACLCSFCHTKATYSASAHNCFIPHNAKLELFALLQMNMGILRRVQIAILILACIAWFSCANHEAIDMGISIWYYISKLALFTLDFVLLLRVWCVYLHIYEFILLLYIIYFLSQVSEDLWFVKVALEAWGLFIFIGNIVQYDTDFILIIIIFLCL